MAAFYVGQIDYITQLNILESRIITLPIVIGNSGKFLYTDGNTTSWQTALTITDVNTAVALETTRATTAEALKAPIASPTFTGTVSGITKAMVGLDQVDNTLDINKPVSTATTAAIAVANSRALAAEALLAPQITTYTKTETDTRIQAIVGAAPAALDTLVEIATQLAADESAAAALTTAVSLKAPIASPTFTGTVSGITKAMVGLDQVDNTSDINKPVSTATTTAIGVETTRATTAEALKAPIASPTFTGTVSGITKAMVGLGQVDNTSDINKPVSTATTTAIGVETTRATTAEALKAPIASPTFTGTATIPTLNLTNALAVAYGGSGISTAPANGAVDIGNGTGFTRTTLTPGSGITITNAAGSITISATSGGGTVTSVTGTAPVVSSGGNTPAISMAAASAGVNGYMTGVYATKLDGIATGATANTGTVTSVSGTGTVSGLTLSGTVTGSGSLTLGGTIGTLNQNTTGTAGGLTGTPNITVGTITSGDVTTFRSGAPTTGYIYWGNTGTKYMGFDGANIVASVSPSFSITGSSASCTGNSATASAVAFSGITSKPTTLSGYGITNADVSGGNFGGSFNFNTNANLASGTYGFDTGALNGPASVTYSNFLQIKERPDTSAQIVVDYQTGYMYTRGIYLTAPTYSAWQTQLSSGNYNSYAPTLTGTGASGTWGISVTGNSATVGGFTPSASSGVGSRVVVADSNGYIFNNYFNSTDNAISSGVTAIMSKASDNYYRSASAAAVATFISGQSMSISGNATNVTGTVAVANGGTGQTTGYKLFDVAFTSNINANTDRTAGSYGSYASSATNTPTNSGILYNFLSGTGGAGDGGQLWQSYVSNELYLRQRWGGTYGSWLTILSASNYNSYAPTLTGGSASGTWGISITGNAATATSATSATSATTATGLNSSNYINSTGSSGNYNTDFQNTTAYTYRYNGDSANVTNNPGGTWWFIENMRHSNSSNYWGTQIAWGWEDNANRLATRNVSGGGFGAWVYYLNSSNYTSYAPSLTGSGASGTWAISITGSATTVSNSNSSQNGDGWWRSSGSAGWYSTTYAVGIYATEAGNVRTYNGASFIAAGNVTAYSDERLKTNWRDMPRDFIERLSLVKNGTYDRTDKCAAKTQDGVSAQSLQPLMPNSIQTDSDGIMSIAYGSAAMVSAVQLAKRVVEQDARIAKLEALVNQLIKD